MTVSPIIDPARLIEEQLAQASPDLLRELLTTFINTLMSAEADAVCGAAYGTSSPERINRRNGYRHRDFDTRTGTLDLEIPNAGRRSLPRSASESCGRLAAPPGGVHASRSINFRSAASQATASSLVITSRAGGAAGYPGRCRRPASASTAVSAGVRSPAAPAGHATYVQYDRPYESMSAHLCPSNGASLLRLNYLVRARSTRGHSVTRPPAWYLVRVPLLTPTAARSRSGGLMEAPCTRPRTGS